MTLPIAAGAGIRVRLPDGAIAEPADALPAIEIGNLPGATVPVRAGFRGPAETVRVICATGPSRGWAPGVEELVLGRVSQIARGALGGDVTRFDVEGVVAVADRFEQRFSATVRRGDASIAVEGRHVLGFAGEAHDAVACSVVCLTAGEQRGCAPLVEASGAEGAWVAAPPPNLLVRGILAAAEEPLWGAGIVGAATVAVVALVIARRPRPRAG